NTNTANGSSRLAIQRPVRTACEPVFRFLGLIILRLGRLGGRPSLLVEACQQRPRPMMPAGHPD
ncbi:MAG TPA: hypothetical protein VOA19_16080, partial [Actinomycetes bacterium]|nr:hypothetical protein [Actinomycetes bacterium]